MQIELSTGSLVSSMNCSVVGIGADVYHVTGSSSPIPSLGATLFMATTQSNRRRRQHAARSWPASILPVSVFRLNCSLFRFHRRKSRIANMPGPGGHPSRAAAMSSAHSPSSARDLLIHLNRTTGTTSATRHSTIMSAACWPRSILIWIASRVAKVLIFLRYTKNIRCAHCPGSSSTPT